jgi:ketopantoate hydroxymethyltransferase
MGAGAGGHAQYLFTDDVLGQTSGHVPRHAKVYANFAAEHARLQALRFRSNQDEAKWGDAMAEHTQMVQALAARDGQALGRILQQHLQHKTKLIGVFP